MWEKLKSICGDRRVQGAVGVLAIVLFWFSAVRLPRPPEPGLVAIYQGGKVTAEELRRYLHEYLPRCPRHLRCPLHGEEHDACTGDEECETFITCGDEHLQAHTLSVYRQAAASLVADRLIGDLVAKKKLAEKKKARHWMKHVTEEINISDLHRDWHKGKIRVEESEIKEYYERNRGKFGARTLSEVSEDIRTLLTDEKEKAFVQNYLKELRENSGVSINYALIEYPEPDEEQLRTTFFEQRDEFRRPARVEILLVEIPIGGASDSEKLAREARILLLGGASLSQVQSALAGKGAGEAAAEQKWISESEALWGDMGLGRRVPGEVTDVIDAENKALIARVEVREEPRLQPFEEIRDDLARRAMEKLRERHLKDNRNATLFTIHGEPYSLGDFMEEFEELTPWEQARYDTPKGRKELVEAMVERALIVEDASDDLRAQRNRKQIDRIRLAVLKQVLHEEDVDDKIAVTDDELREFFQKNAHYYRQPARVKISYIRVAAARSGDDEKRAKQKAEKALAELEALSAEQLAGDGFAQVAKRYSDDPEVAETGGRLAEWISESDDVLTEFFYHDFHTNVMPLERGEISPVFQMRDRFYIVFVREREEARGRSFDEVKKLVRQDLTELKHYELTAKMEADLAGKAAAKIYDYTLLDMLKEEARGQG
ncbi:MAG: hypothetical protein GWP08_10450 [Nitrospiraceae bacterium]|nr:hypothetical protein [Nitrospiraceae bacterium]